MSKVIGIDVGTTTTVVSVLEQGNPVNIVSDDGSKYIPSIVGFAKSGDVLVGNAAKRQMVTNPTRTVYEYKRFIGRTYDESKKEIQSFPFKVENINNVPKIRIDDKQYTAQEICARVITKAKQIAENYLGETVTDAVITVPARFNDDQKRATKEAAEIAGLNVLRIIPEPSAAILSAYQNTKSNFKCAVADIGGGTYDISIIDVDSDGIFETITTDGDALCGGKDVDNAIANWLVEEFKKDRSIDLSKDPMAMQRLKEAAEKAKVELSGMSQTEINLPFISATADGPLHLNYSLNRSTMEQLADSFFKKIEECTKRVGDKIGGWDNVDDVLIVGGSSRIPKFVELIESTTGRKVSKPQDVDLAVSFGAAIQAGIVSGDKDTKDILLIERLPISIGIETLGDVFVKMIEADTTYPTKKTEVFSTAADNQPAVNVHVLQGERALCTANKSLGRFDLTGLPPAPRGMPQIEVTFDLDVNGLLTVTAKDRATNKQQSIKITGSSQLDKNEIERMKREAKEHETEDKRIREEKEIINSADSYSYSIKKAMQDNEGKIPNNDHDQLINELSGLDEAIKSSNINNIKSAKGILEQHWNMVVTTLYDNATPEAEQAAATENPVNENADAGGVNATYEDVTDK